MILFSLICYNASYNNTNLYQQKNILPRQKRLRKVPKRSCSIEKYYDNDSSLYGCLCKDLLRFYSIPFSQPLQQWAEFLWPRSAQLVTLWGSLCQQLAEAPPPRPFYCHLRHHHDHRWPLTSANQTSKDKIQIINNNDDDNNNVRM